MSNVFMFAISYAMLFVMLFFSINILHYSKKVKVLIFFFAFLLVNMSFYYLSTDEKIDAVIAKEGKALIDNYTAFSFSEAEMNASKKQREILASMDSYCLSSKDSNLCYFNHKDKLSLGNFLLKVFYKTKQKPDFIFSDNGDIYIPTVDLDKDKKAPYGFSKKGDRAYPTDKALFLKLAQYGIIPILIINKPEGS